MTYPDVDNLSACGVGACWQVQASAGRASPTGPCCTGAGRAALINVDEDVVGNGGGITVGQLRDSTCCRWGNPPNQEDSTPCDRVKWACLIVCVSVFCLKGLMHDE